jgi:Gpi18-like mannosyltransferase
MSQNKWLGIIYLLSPFSWYESAVWGQNDQLGMIFLLISFWLLIKNKWLTLAPILMAISVGLKPTGMIFAPLFMWLAIKNKKQFLKVVIGGIITLVLYGLMAKLISSRDIVAFSLHLQKEMFVKGEWWTWANSFNFWRAVTGYLTNYNIIFL